MKAIRNLILASTFMVVLYEGAFCHSIRTDFVLLNQPYTFPGNASGCHHAEWRKRPPIDTTIATYKNHACTTDRIFEEEFTCKDNHLLLKSSKYTDQGPYEFICNGVQTLIHLDVLYALTESAEETNNITLNCYAHNAKDVKWLHNNESVLHYKINGSENPGKGYEGRVFLLEKNCFKTGDLSLTVTRVRKADAGIYRCFVDDETVKGNPHAYVLHVNEKNSGPGDQTHSSCNEAILIALTVVFGLISVISVTYLITIELRNHQSKSTTVTQSSEGDTTETERMLMSAISTTSPINESQWVVTYPVQESDFTGNKPSNTRPIL
ncbi:uncharacterized protein LOC107689167 isoform X1 [Sinocyclocheilus anshuiensis]|uniref:uncharacterized protein LOC107689167 isoform X1 n=1 Tax=Sinocyclocheilus anshuiensis TaxID=1608454 RepID=UPI0007B7B826|nr:PREDICTED: uncharacterized protein LOC107689167 isoform X1 [Sinocyclocheilus anshuiensis]